MAESRLLLDNKKQRDDLRLLHMAARKRWNIPDHVRQKIVERLTDIVDGEDDELSIKAIAEFRHLESQNQKDEHKLIDVNAATRDAELSAIAADLGIDPSLIIDATIEAGGGLVAAPQRAEESIAGRSVEGH